MPLFIGRGGAELILRITEDGAAAADRVQGIGGLSAIAGLVPLSGERKGSEARPKAVVAAEEAAVGAGMVSGPAIVKPFLDEFDARIIRFFTGAGIAADIRAGDEEAAFAAEKAVDGRLQSGWEDGEGAAAQGVAAGRGPRASLFLRRR